MTEARYANSKVYMLVDDDGYYYYGSSCLPLYKRLFYHKGVAKLESNRKLYTVFTYERFCKGDIKIVLVEEFKLENKEQLLREENKYIKRNIDDPFCLNSFHAVLNYEKMKEKKKECDKIYRETHKEQKRERDKIYNETHKEQIKERIKIYRDTHQEKIKEYQNTKYTCPCGSVVTIPHKLRHKRSKKHQEFIKDQQE